MSQQSIDPQYQESLNHLKTQIEEFKSFFLDVESKKQEIESAFHDFSLKKQKLDTLVEQVNDAEIVYNNVKLGADQKIEYINSISSHADNAKERIDAAEVHIGQQKGKIDSDAQTIETAKTRFESLKTASEALSIQLEEQHTNLQKQIDSINGKANTLKELEENLENQQIAAEAAKTGSEAAHQAIQEQQATFQQSVEQTTQKLNELNEQQASLQKNIQEVKDAHTEITGLHEELFIDAIGDDNQIAEPCLKTQIHELYTKLEQEYNTIKTKNANEEKNYIKNKEVRNNQFDALYNELNDKINALLPGAGAAGLASSYFEAKMRYTTMDDHLTSDDKKGGVKTFFAKMITPQFLFYAFHLVLFLIPLMAIVYVFLPSHFEIPKVFETQPYAILLYKATITLPMVAISSYGVMALVTNRKLYEEYNHKQRVMQLYHSFKKEVDTSSDNELKIKLLHVMLDVVREKPATKLSKYEKSMFGVLQDEIHTLSEKVLGGK